MRPSPARTSATRCTPAGRPARVRAGPRMNSLGRGRDACVPVLRAYLAEVRRLVNGAAANDQAPECVTVAHDLDRLAFQLEVDVAARSGAAGTERVTEVESKLPLPALVRLREDAVARLATAPTSGWASTLTGAQSALGDATASLRSWRPRGA